MRIDPVCNQGSTNFRGIWEKISKPIESVVTTAKATTDGNKVRKTVPMELHTALVRLTAYRMALLFSVLSGFLGYKAGDKISDNDTKVFANTVQNTDIDTTVPFEIKDMNSDGSKDIVLQKKDGSKVVLDLKNSNVLVESTGFKNAK